VNTRLLIGIVLLVSRLPLAAVPLTESTFTDVVRSVEVINATDKSATPAKLQEVFKAPNLIRTGVSSRAELTAPDQSLTRVGANTVFSFAPVGREIDLAQGSVLFHSPSGRGGGTIKSGGASAAVSGTTLIVACTLVEHEGDHNGFKVILLEGTGHVTLPNGQTATLKAGQMIYILPNHTGFGPLLNINLGKLVNGSALVIGFTHPLPSLPLVQLAIHEQQLHLNTGQVVDTGTPADKFINNPPPPNFGPATTVTSGDPSPKQITTFVTITPPVDGHPSKNPFQIPGFPVPRSPQVQPPFNSP
jgi:quercetin dioxygenase-like cupin family protein